MKLDRHRAGTLLAVLLCGRALFAHPETRSEKDGFDFVQHELVLGKTVRQTVLTGFLFGSETAELVVVHVDERGERRLGIYAFGNGWKLAHEAKLPAGVVFVDVVNVGGRDRLVLGEPGRLSWYDPEVGEERLLVPASSCFAPPRTDEVPHVDVGHDLNGDGRADLAVPEADGFRVLVQEDGGRFAAPMKVGAPADLRSIYGADGYRYDPWSVSRVHRIDHDGDGCVDLVHWSDGGFEAHLQDGRGSFARASVRFTTEVAFDSDDPAALSTGRREGRVLHSLVDWNGDGIGDLVVFSLQGTRTRRKTSAYEVHLGERVPGGGTRFAKDADVVFRPRKRILLGMDRHDLDRDGEPDLMLTTIERRFLSGSLWKSLKGAFGADIGLGLDFYRRKDGRYGAVPDAVRAISLDGVPSHREPGSISLGLVLRGATHERRRTERKWPRAFNNPLLIGDLTGDGRADLVIGGHPRKLDVYAGIPGPSLFAPKPHSIDVPPPNDEEYMWLVDLNKDGVQDLLMHHPFTQRDLHGKRRRPLGSEPHRVTTLIAR